MWSYPGKYTNYEWYWFSNPLWAHLLTWQADGYFKTFWNFVLEILGQVPTLWVPLESSESILPPYLYRHPRYKIHHSHGFVQKCGISNIGYYPGFRFVTGVGIKPKYGGFGISNTNRDFGGFRFETETGISLSVSEKIIRPPIWTIREPVRSPRHHFFNWKWLHSMDTRLH